MADTTNAKSLQEITKRAIAEREEIEKREYAEWEKAWLKKIKDVCLENAKAGKFKAQLEIHENPSIKFTNAFFSTLLTEFEGCVVEQDRRNGRIRYYISWEEA